MAVARRTVTVYLGMKALEEAQAESSLSEDDAMKLANAELHAMRSERDVRSDVLLRAPGGRIVERRDRRREPISEE
jgi:predicted TIM-barrel enzyme